MQTCFDPVGWISLARVEEEAGRIAKAREHLVEAMKKCPKSEDVWLEAARLDVRPMIIHAH